MHFHFCVCAAAMPRVSQTFFAAAAALQSIDNCRLVQRHAIRLICMHITACINENQVTNVHCHTLQGRKIQKTLQACTFLTKKAIGVLLYHFFVSLGQIKSSEGTKAVMKNQNSFKLLFMVIIFLRFLRK